MCNLGKVKSYDEPSKSSNACDSDHRPFSVDRWNDTVEAVKELLGKAGKSELESSSEFGLLTLE